MMYSRKTSTNSSIYESSQNLNKSRSVVQLQQRKEFHQLVPTVEDIKNQKQYEDYYASVPKNGRAYASRSQYLQNNYYLLKEDFFIEIRKQLYNIEKDIRQINSKDTKNLFQLYCQASIKDILFDRQGIILNIDCKPLFIKKSSQFSWKNSKRLWMGSLLILTDESFSKMYYLTVKQIDDRIDEIYKRDGLVRFSAQMYDENIESNQMLDTIIAIQEYCKKNSVLIFETKYYWEAYYHTLKVIKQMKDNQINICFKKLILSQERQLILPEFVSKNTIYEINLNPQARKQKIYLQESYWNKIDKGTLDTSQFESLFNMLTQQISIVQGPPGTGKTFIGSQFVKIILDNQLQWNLEGSPILIVCQSNHALDQFLKHIEIYHNKILRIGGFSKDPSMIKYSLKNLRDQFKEEGNYFKSPCLNELKQLIDDLQNAYKNSIVDIDNIQYHTYLQQMNIEFKIDFKQMIIDGFIECFGRVDKQFQSEIVESWWKNEIEFDVYQRSIKIEEQIQTWNKRASKEKEQFLNQINSQVVNKYSIFNELEEQEEIDEELSDEEEYIEFMDKYEIDYNNGGYGFLNRNRQQQQASISFIKCSKTKITSLFAQMRQKRFNIFNLTYEQRYLIKSYVGEQIQKPYLQEIKQYMQRYISLTKKYQEEQAEDNARIIKDQHIKIVGMTLNGAAINNQLIKYLKPPIVIVEEAGQILENILIPILQPSTKQLVLIGDHVQLKPQVNSEYLRRNFSLNTSLMERLISNQVSFSQLKVQRRMRPEFAEYIRLIYSNYQNHKDVSSIPNIKCLPSNIYLINHNNQEVKVDNSTSKKNEYEANYCIELAKYIIDSKECKENEITILSMYLGQIQLIRQMAKKYKLLDIKCTTVDNYQGEENEIIILSLVRSNSQGNLGYIKEDNRINVAFSRARKGFYCIGNFTMINRFSTDQSLWKKIISNASQKGHLIDNINFYCNQHTDKHLGSVKHFKDFEKISRFVCGSICNKQMDCEHKCLRKCHYKQMTMCEQQVCTQMKYKLASCRKHKYWLQCNQSTEGIICEEITEKKLFCGHTIKQKCNLSINNIQCFEKVIVNLNCGHSYQTNCNTLQTTQYVCKELTSKYLNCKVHQIEIECNKSTRGMSCKAMKKIKLPCNHYIEQECYLPTTNIQCTKQLQVKLECGHTYTTTCYQYNNEQYLCQELVNKTLLCGHVKEIKCGVSINNILCDNTLHNKNLQYEYCCDIPVVKTLLCGHKVDLLCCQDIQGIQCIEIDNFNLLCGHTVKTSCYAFRNKQIQCTQPTTKTLLCGHRLEMRCNVSVNQVLCDNTINILRQGDYQYACGKTMIKMLSCGHEVELPCIQTTNGVVCDRIISTELPCQHYSQITCHDLIYNNYNCQLKCNKILPKCKHRCQQKCCECDKQHSSHFIKCKFIVLKIKQKCCRSYVDIQCHQLKDFAQGNLIIQQCQRCNPHV